MLAKVVGYDGKFIKAITLEDDKCGSCKNCSKAVGGKEILVKSDKFEPINSVIEIEVESKYLLQASFLLFGVPALFLIFCILLLPKYSVVVAVVAIALYYVLLYVKNDAIKKSGRYCAKVVERKTYGFNEDR